jgi:hypothetical protein
LEQHVINNFFLNPNKPEKRILLVSLQKCGTHLIKNVFEQAGLEGLGVGRATLSDFHKLRKNQYLWSHFTPTDEVQMELENKNTDLRVIFNFRDPRDVLVSWYYWMKDSSSKILHNHQAYMKKVYSQFSEKELINIFIHNDKFRQDEYNPLEQFRLSRVLYFYPDVFNVRFEDLIGSKGGGCDNRQQQVINDILYFIGSHNFAGDIKNIFDVNSPTFRNGKIGGYKNLLSTEQLQLINELHGDLIDQYGYSRD